MGERRTLARTIGCEGVGIHGGERVRVELGPAAPGSGIGFAVAVGGSVHPIPARASALHASLNATSLSTEPGSPSARAAVATVEHLLAALLASGVDDATVTVVGGEVPILDGSALPFVELLDRAGLRSQPGPRRAAIVARPLAIEEGDRRIAVEPCDVLAIDYTIDFDHPAIGRQHHACAAVDMDWFRREVAPARTFGFLRDVEMLRAAGLAGGASLANTLVFDEASLLNPEPLRFADECVRHKVIDLLGDLALLGAPLRARVSAHRAGHALHQRLVQTLLATPDALGWQEV